MIKSAREALLGKDFLLVHKNHEAHCSLERMDARYRLKKEEEDAAAKNRPL